MSNKLLYILHFDKASSCRPLSSVGRASDSRPEGHQFKSGRGQTIFLSKKFWANPEKHVTAGSG
jgi:hypothetical protein